MSSNERGKSQDSLPHVFLRPEVIKRQPQLAKDLNVDERLSLVDWLYSRQVLQQVLAMIMFFMLPQLCSLYHGG
jgi:hypothetical protein